MASYHRRQSDRSRVNSSGSSTSQNRRAVANLASHRVVKSSGRHRHHRTKPTPGVPANVSPNRTWPLRRADEPPPSHVVTLSTAVRQTPCQIPALIPGQSRKRTMDPLPTERPTTTTRNNPEREFFQLAPPHFSVTIPVRPLRDGQHCGQRPGPTEPSKKESTQYEQTRSKRGGANDHASVNCQRCKLEHLFARRVHDADFVQQRQLCAAHHTEMFDTLSVSDNRSAPQTVSFHVRVHLTSLHDIPTLRVDHVTWNSAVKMTRRRFWSWQENTAT